MKIPTNLLYTKDHEWIRIDGEVVVMGITDFAQSELGEVVFVELPEIGKEVKKGEVLCVVESTKAASDVYAPVSGKVVEINESLTADSAALNHDSYESGWMVKLEPQHLAEEKALLLDESGYSALTER
jgi:glycine cleavage system H protein